MARSPCLPSSHPTWRGSHNLNIFIAVRLYYHNKIGSIPLFDNIRKLMEASYGSSAIDMKTAADLLAVKSLQDPVRDFVDFYFHEQGVSIGDTDMSYVVNRLYNAKGGLE